MPEKITAERIGAVQTFVTRVGDGVVLRVTTAAGRNHYFELEPEEFGRLAKQMAADAAMLSAAPAGDA